MLVYLTYDQPMNTAFTPPIELFEVYHSGAWLPSDLGSWWSSPTVFTIAFADVSFLPGQPWRYLGPHPNLTSATGTPARAQVSTLGSTCVWPMLGPGYWPRPKVMPDA